ncbi:IS3 family transposase [Bacillus mycoides]|uniref:IS3 family transposase n=1 Tax=Bacillus mycoides TaxID=1405 RepID=UPI001C025B45
MISDNHLNKDFQASKVNEGKLAVLKYIHFYNHQRFQKTLNNLSPYKYRTQVA